MTDQPLTPEALDTLLRDIEAIAAHALNPNSRATEATEFAFFIVRNHLPVLIEELRRLRTENEEQRERYEIADTQLQEEHEAAFATVRLQRSTALAANMALAAERDALQAKIDAALVEVGNTDFSTFEALQEDLADRVRAALTGEAKE